MSAIPFGVYPDQNCTSRFTFILDYTYEIPDLINDLDEHSSACSKASGYKENN